jgi:hypothetical protein
MGGLEEREQHKEGFQPSELVIVSALYSTDNNNIVDSSVTSLIYPGWTEFDGFRSLSRMTMTVTDQSTPVPLQYRHLTRLFAGRWSRGGELTSVTAIPFCLFSGRAMREEDQDHD